MQSQQHCLRFSCYTLRILSGLLLSFIRCVGNYPDPDPSLDASKQLIQVMDKFVKKLSASPEDEKTFVAMWQDAESMTGVGAQLDLSKGAKYIAWIEKYREAMLRASRELKRDPATQKQVAAVMTHVAKSTLGTTTQERVLQAWEIMEATLACAGTLIKELAASPQDLKIFVAMWQEVKNMGAERFTTTLMDVGMPPDKGLRYTRWIQKYRENMLKASQDLKADPATQKQVEAIMALVVGDATGIHETWEFMEVALDEGKHWIELGQSYEKKVQGESVSSSASTSVATSGSSSHRATIAETMEDKKWKDFVDKFKTEMGKVADGDNTKKQEKVTEAEQWIALCKALALKEKVKRKLLSSLLEVEDDEKDKGENRLRPVVLHEVFNKLLDGHQVWLKALLLASVEFKNKKRKEILRALIKLQGAKYKGTDETLLMTLLLAKETSKEMLFSITKAVGFLQMPLLHKLNKRASAIYENK